MYTFKLIYAFNLFQLYRPTPVDIPERYVSDNEEQLSPEQREQRQMRSHRFKKIVAAQRQEINWNYLIDNYVE